MSEEEKRTRRRMIVRLPERRAVAPDGEPAFRVTEGHRRGPDVRALRRAIAEGALAEREAPADAPSPIGPAPADAAEAALVLLRRRARSG